MTHIERLFDLVLDLKKDIEEIKEISMKNTVVLDAHERRSTSSEKRLELLEEKHDQILTAIDARMKPVETHVQNVAFIFRAMAWTAGIIGAVGGFLYSILKSP